MTYWGLSSKHRLERKRERDQWGKDSPWDYSTGKMHQRTTKENTGGLLRLLSKRGDRVSGGNNLSPFV